MPESRATIPPPPTLPDFPRRQVKPSAPPLASKAITSTAKESAKVAQTTTSNAPFEPCPMFFYGTLQDPEVLQSILSLPAPPILTPATISGFEIRMWGIYPALVPADRSRKVTGCVIDVVSKDQFERLVAYETNAYTWVECKAYVGGGTVGKKCLTFCWAGDANSKELENGYFDLERWKQYFKGSVAGKEKAEH